MPSSFLYATSFLIHFFAFINYPCSGTDSDNLQDVCPTSTTSPIFINGFPCKNPLNITASDFKNSILNSAGDTDNAMGSSITMVTAAEFPGLNTLGLSSARTDLEVDGLVMPHSHPRASEMAFVLKGVVIAGFIDTSNQVFQSQLKEGDIFVFPRGLLHFCLNTGFEEAIVLSVLNSQNPGFISISDAMFGSKDSEVVKTAMAKLISLYRVVEDRVDDVNSF